VSDAEPLREVEIAHRCACILIGVVQNGERYENRCAGWTNNPDSPFCDPCIAEGHDLLPQPRLGEVVKEMNRGR